MAGAGVQAAGTTPAGVGTPVEGTSPGALQRGEALYIDPRTLAYVRGPDGVPMRASRAAQFVTLAIFTAKNSSAVASQGLASPPSIVEDKISERLKQDLLDALQPGVDAGLISIVSIEAHRHPHIPSRMMRSVVWLDLATQQEQSTPF